MFWGVKVIWKDGGEELLQEGCRTARFSNRDRAQQMAEFMRMGMSDDTQSISVVKFPERGIRCQTKDTPSKSASRSTKQKSSA